ncbi:MAG: DEAD/DEAH box helicase family protein [Methanosphaera sp.]|nr:DEAD/DEAH box helicase family protein [Methanosphaera sp.]
MSNTSIKTTNNFRPQIYAYTTPGIKEHDGWIKIGYTEGDVDKRIDQQSHTIDVETKKEWQGIAIFEDGSWESFKDTDFHAYLRKQDKQQKKGTEWFHISPDESKEMFYEFKSNHGIIKDSNQTSTYVLRDEQEDAISKTISYKNNGGKEFLWNAKPRFGKTLSVYDFIKRIDAKRVLIVTNRPAIATSWYSDYEKFMSTDSGYRFVSSTSYLRGKSLVRSYEEYERENSNDNTKYNLIEFVSLQDLKGSKYFGGSIDKLVELTDKWDVLVIDEAHEGVDTYKTDVAFDHIDRNFTLHLSGTPFKALASDKFPEDAIYNWTYSDEQSAKENWDKEEDNPYENLPRLNLFTYQMSEIISDILDDGIKIDGQTREYAFDLNEFFKTNSNGFIHEESVDKFLDALTTQEKYPFSTKELRDELKHTFWLLNRVDSAKVLGAKLKNHPVFENYEIVVVAGDGKLSDNDESTKNAYDKVVKAINEHDKTITLSVGQLTTGVTIPEWSAVLMLSNIESPQLYMQAAFRSQNPWIFSENDEYKRKDNAYVFDFNPERSLTIFEEFANDLSPDTINGRGDSETREKHIRELLNFFPVIGEDDEGKMVELDAKKVLSVPRKIRSQEVVNQGFMSNFLFQNISNIFNAPQEVIDIVSNFEPVAKPKKDIEKDVNENTAKELSLDENGEVSLDDEYIEKEKEDFDTVSRKLLGNKIYADISDDVIEPVKNKNKQERNKVINNTKKEAKENIINPIITVAKEQYKIKGNHAKQLKNKITSDVDRVINKTYDDHTINMNKIEKKREEDLSQVTSKEEEDRVNEEYDTQIEEENMSLPSQMNDTLNIIIKESVEYVIEDIKTNMKEDKKKTLEDSLKDHLRGFSRTIPSFLMAYGDDDTTLATFDQIIPDEVFREVTSISLDQFRFLRDGGKYTNKTTGQKETFKGNLFDPVVFDDSVKEFMNLRRELSNYFDDKQDKDIFDYIPPQKTNQIFTPKKTVVKMVDYLEEANPGCFDDPDNTFIDLYMKSGLYITEIVKRLYNSEEIMRIYPDSDERLKHIFEKQVYGLAPTDIIYNIARNFILGFDEENIIEKDNFRQVDSLYYAQEGVLEDKIDELFG